MIANSSPGVFAYGHSFQRGDVPIFITDVRGNPLSPFTIRYCLLHKSKDGSCFKLIGPAERNPVQAAIGEYYITGWAGECSQPGEWMVRWTLQEYFEGPLMCPEFKFLVFDPSEYLTALPTPASNCAQANRSCGHCNCGSKRGW